MVQNRLPRVEFKISTYHSSIAVERVRSGDSMVALVQGASTIAPDLLARPLFDQVMTIVPSGLKPFRFPMQGILDLLVIEKHTEAWKFTRDAIRKNRSTWGVELRAQKTLESFSAIIQMARAGFGHGLAPLGLARTFGIPLAKLVSLPAPGISLPVSLVARRSTHVPPLIQQFYRGLIETVSDQDRLK